MALLNNKLKLLLVISISLSLSVGCSGGKAIETISKLMPDTGSKSLEQAKEPVKEPQKFFAPFTGEQVDEKTSKNIPFMAIIENSKDARPQSGLADADIVYETMAEGGIPRFMALFQKNSPKIIGPIRSARAYFVNISKEYNLPFAHCGYSDEAKAMIESENLMSMNEFTYGKYFWRDNERKAPHNLYTSADKLREIVSSKSYLKSSNVKLYFNSEFWTSESLSSAKTVILKLNRYYVTDYTYKEGKYYKNMDGTAAINKEDKRPISVDNIVIQITTVKLQKDNSHLDIALTGEGEGYVFSNGKYTKMKWSKKNVNSQTVIKDENGLEIPLSPGNTWWHIIDMSNIVEIK